MQKKEFTEPKMTKCEQPLDKVTMQFGGCYGANNQPNDPFNGGNDNNGGFTGGKR